MKLLAVALAALFLGCTTPAAASKEGIWTESFAEDTNITDCQDAIMTLKLAKLQSDKLQSLLDDKDNPIKSQSVRTIISAQQMGLWHLEDELVKWMTDSCKTA